MDGQQRLTTFSILVNEIISFVKGLECNIDIEAEKEPVKGLNTGGVKE